MSTIELEASIESWPLAQAFVISRGAKRETIVVTATLTRGSQRGRGECVPYAHYGQNPKAVRDEILASACGGGRGALQSAMPAGPARNALDCALWDLEAKETGRTVRDLLGLSPVRRLLTCYTLSLATPGAMAEQARQVRDLPLLKLKLGGGPDDAARMRAVRAARPDARLIADANESWREQDLVELLAVAHEAGLELIEQPLSTGEDHALASVRRSVPVCADESVHSRADLAALRDRYDAVNIKLDKAGGLTEAVAMSRAARRLGFKIMVGSMVATSLSMAPAFLVGQDADWVDLDSPLLLARDRAPGIAIANGWIEPPPPEVWG